MYIAVNKLKVQKARGDELEQRFQHAGAVAGEPGFLGFELWKLDADGEHEEFLVVSRWESEEAHSQWTKSESFKQAHSGPPADFILGHGEFSGYQVKMSVAPEG